MEIINDFLARLNGSIRQCEYSINKNNSSIKIEYFQKESIFLRAYWPLLGNQ